MDTLQQEALLPLLAIMFVALLITAIAWTLLLDRKLNPKGVSLIVLSDDECFTVLHDSTVFRATKPLRQEDGVWQRLCVNVKTEETCWFDVDTKVQRK
jgi:hypothetical protein